MSSLIITLLMCGVFVVGALIGRAGGHGDGYLAGKCAQWDDDKQYIKDMLVVRNFVEITGDGPSDWEWKTRQKIAAEYIANSEEKS